MLAKEIEQIFIKIIWIFINFYVKQTLLSNFSKIR